MRSEGTSYCVLIPRVDYAWTYHLDTIDDPNFWVRSRPFARTRAREMAATARVGLLDRPWSDLPGRKNRLFLPGRSSVFLVYEWAPRSSDPDYIGMLRARYPQSRFVYYYTNPIALQGLEHLRRIEKLYDLVATFDPLDSDRYGIFYQEPSYSPPRIESSGRETDVVFVGQGKGRTKQLVEIYHRLRSIGATCDFSIFRPDEGYEEQTDLQINWRSRLSYREVLEKVASSKTVLDFVVSGQSGPSLRSREALALGRRLMTNNEAVRILKSYNAEQFVIFSGSRWFDPWLACEQPNPLWRERWSSISSYEMFDSIVRRLEGQSAES